jgi:hypothetical protein
MAPSCLSQRGGGDGPTLGSRTPTRGFSTTDDLYLPFQRDPVLVDPGATNPFSRGDAEREWPPSGRRQSGPTSTTRREAEGESQVVV